MTKPAYYNEFDPYAAQWLRNLIAAGHLPEGEVDERSITEVRGLDLGRFGQCHFFAGIGGWPLALRMAGVPDDEPIWTGSCPCQPFSNAGKRRGTADERHLWPEFLRLIAECRPARVYGEQVASGGGRKWLAGVRNDLEGNGYACAAADLCAAGIGAPHVRQRLYWMAHADGERRRKDGLDRPNDLAPNSREAGDRPGDASALDAWREFDSIATHDGRKRRIESGTFPLAHGIPARVGRLRAYGNAIVPQLAAAFVRATL